MNVPIALEVDLPAARAPWRAALAVTRAITLGGAMIAALAGTAVAQVAPLPVGLPDMPTPAVGMPVAPRAALDRHEIRAQLMPRRYTTVAAEIGAKISQLPFQEGAAFKAGDKLVGFDCSLQQAQLDKAQAELESAGHTLKSNQRLAELNSVGMLELDLSRAAVAKATVDDSAFEGAEAFKLTAGFNTAALRYADGVGGTLRTGASANANSTIYDDGSIDGDDGSDSDTTTVKNDDRPSFAVNDVTVNEAAGTLTFTVTKIGSTTQNATVAYAFADGSATTGGTGAANDFTGTAGTLTFAAGETSKTITVTINNDSVFEGSESFNLNLSGATGATIGDAQGVGTIKDDGTGGDDDGDNTDNATDAAKNDDRPTLSITGMNVEEGSRATFTVTLSNALAANTAIDLALSHVDTTSADFNASTYQWSEDGGTTWASVSNNQITLTAGKTSFLVRVATVDDSAFEGAEAFKLTAGFNTAALRYADGVGGTLRTGASANANSTKPPQEPQVEPKQAEPKSTPPAGTEQAVEQNRQTFISTLGIPEPMARMALSPAPQQIEVGERLTSTSGFPIVVDSNRPPGLQVFRGVTDQFVEGTSVAKVSMPADAFVHSKSNAVIELVASQPDGSALPPWIRFDSRTGSFEVEGAPAEFKGKVDIKVVARDGEGGEATVLFRIFVGDKPANDKPGERPQGRSSLSEKLRLAIKRPGLDLSLKAIEPAPVRQAQEMQEVQQVQLSQTPAEPAPVN